MNASATSLTKTTTTVTTGRNTFVSTILHLFALLTEFVPKLILEVFGGAGAIWGFSEACGLRRPDTIWFWRPASLCIGFLFFLHWFHQGLEKHKYLQSLKKKK